MQVTLYYENDQHTLQINHNFKTFLNQLNELYPNLPETFVIYYIIPEERRGVYIGCPEDYRVYLRNLSQLKFGNNYQPLLQILRRETENVFNNNLAESEKSQMLEFENLSQLAASINSDSNPPTQLSLSKKPSYEYQGYHKCQLCYEPLEEYFRCLTCFFFQLCKKCNKDLRYEHHSKLHIFIFIQSERGEFDDLKDKAYKKIQDQKKNFDFKIHQRLIHESIICDKCNHGPIIGKRYKCLDCLDYDLCQICFETNEHREKKHNFIQMDQSLEFMKI